MTHNHIVGYQDGYLHKQGGEEDPALSPEQVMYNTYKNIPGDPHPYSAFTRDIPQLSRKYTIGELTDMLRQGKPMPRAPASSAGATTEADFKAIRNQFPGTVVRPVEERFRYRKAHGEYAPTLFLPEQGLPGGRPAAYHEVAHAALAERDNKAYDEFVAKHPPHTREFGLGREAEKDYAAYRGRQEWPAMLVDEATSQQQGTPPPPSTHVGRHVSEGLRRYGPKLSGTAAQNIQAIRRWVPAAESIPGATLPSSSWQRGAAKGQYSLGSQETDAQRAAKLSAGHESFKKWLPSAAK